MLTKPPVHYDFCVGVPISRLHTVGSTPVNSVLNVKAVVAAFNQEEALVGAFSVFTNLRMELFQALVKAYTGSMTEWIKMGGEVEK